MYGRRSLMNTIKRSVRGGDAALCQIYFDSLGQTHAAPGAMVKSPAGRLDTLNGRRCGHLPNYYDHLLLL